MKQSFLTDANYDLYLTKPVFFYLSHGVIANNFVQIAISTVTTLLYKGVGVA